MENAKLVASATQSCVVKMLFSISLLLSKSIHIREIRFFLPKKHDVFKSQLRTNCYSISGRRKLSFKHEKLSNFSPCFILGHWWATMTATHGNASAHPCKCENNLASCIFRKFTLKNDLIEPTKFSRMNKKNRILHTL